MIPSSALAFSEAFFFAIKPVVVPIKEKKRMIGLYVIFLLVGVEMLFLIFFDQVWIRAGLMASAVLGVISFIILAIAQFNGNEENFVLVSFFILNMLLPLLFSIEFHLFARKGDLLKRPGGKKSRK